MATIIRSNQFLDAPITDPKHLVNKQYVDDQIGRVMKEPVKVATVSNLTGTYSKSEQTLTLTTVGSLTIDGIAVNAGDRVLVKDQTDKTQNGIYVEETNGNSSGGAILKRAEDFNSSEDISKNLFVRVSEGIDQADLLFQLVNDETVILDTTPILFAKYGGSGGAGTVNKFTGVITGNDTLKTFLFTHNLKTTDIIVSMVKEDTKDIILTNWSSVNENSIQIDFDNALESGIKINVTILG